MKKHVPNIISCFRIVGSFGMIFLRKEPVWFVALYMACGLSDVLDGFLARKYHLESELGTKLDGLGDASFYIVAFGCLIFGKMVDLSLNLAMMVGIAAIAVSKLICLIMTRVKFKQWNSMHTTLLRWIGVFFFVCIPVSVLMGYLPTAMTVSIIAVSILCFVEEGIIVLVSDEYDPSRRILFQRKKQETENA